MTGIQPVPLILTGIVRPVPSPVLTGTQKGWIIPNLTDTQPVSDRYSPGAGDWLPTDLSHDRQRRAEESIKTESGYLSVDCSLPERLGRRCQPARVGTGNSSPERLSRPRQQAREETDSAGGEFQCARCLIGQPTTDPSHDLVAETEDSTTSARCLIGQSPADLSHDLEAATETSVTRVRCLGDQPPTDRSHDRRCQAEEFISLSRPLVGQIFCTVAVVLMVIRWAMGRPTS